MAFCNVRKGSQKEYYLQLYIGAIQYIHNRWLVSRNEYVLSLHCDLENPPKNHMKYTKSNKIKNFQGVYYPRQTPSWTLEVQICIKKKNKKKIKSKWQRWVTTHPLCSVSRGILSQIESSNLNQQIWKRETGENWKREIHANVCDIIHCAVRFVKTGFNVS